MDLKELRAVVITSLCETTDRPYQDFDVLNDTPIDDLSLHSMALFSALLTIEKNMKGDITCLPPETPLPATFGDIVQMAAKIGKLDHLID